MQQQLIYLCVYTLICVWGGVASLSIVYLYAHQSVASESLSAVSAAVPPSNSTHVGSTEPVSDTKPSSTAEEASFASEPAREVPYYSQFQDIAWAQWREKACGIANVAMIIDYYRADAPSAQALLENGIEAGYYIDGAGWSHRGLVALIEQYGVRGTMHGFSDMSGRAAFERLRPLVKRGPLIASVHNEFDPASSIPHLVVVTDIRDDTVYYNDPAADTGAIPKEQFLRAWKQRVIATEAVHES